MSGQDIGSGRVGDIAEEAIVRSRLAQGCEVYILKNASNHGVDVIAHKRTPGGGHHLEVIEVKANTARLQPLQKFGGEEVLRDRLTVAMHTGALSEWKGHDRSEIRRPGADRLERVPAAEIARRIEPLLAKLEVRGTEVEVRKPRAVEVHYTLARVGVDRRTGQVGKITETTWSSAYAARRVKAALRAEKGKAPTLTPTPRAGR